MTKMKDADLIEVIREIHRIWYDREITKDAASALKLHEQLEYLFDYAGIDVTLVDED